jgi:hypothetical protein
VADGGYDTAGFSFASSPSDAKYWIDYGLGSHVTTQNEGLDRIWEGFVNEISVTLGQLAFTRGPLIDLTNRVTLKYSDFLTNEPATEGPTTDATSILAWPIIHRVLSVGQVSEATAGKILDTYLRENRFPSSTTDLSSEGVAPQVEIRCLGYNRFLDLFVYLNAASPTATYTLREKVIDVLALCPNSGLFSTDYSFIETNTLSVFERDFEHKKAYDVIKELVAMGGDSNNNRRLFGIYNDRKAYLQEIPSTYEYQVDSGAVLREDPSKIFIEQVTFTAPVGWQISGGKTGTLSQQLAKLGLSSIG